jgi:uncharacterized membrane protein YfcA
VAYAASSLATRPFSVSSSFERGLGLAAGLATGGITAATGVFVIPAVPYLQAIGLEKDELVQALGLSFTVSTLALAAALAGIGGFSTELIMPSLAAVAVALLGMRLGQSIRARLSARSFRLCFFAGLLALGLYLALRGLA